jgi:hypothetical protein
MAKLAGKTPIKLTAAGNLKASPGSLQWIQVSNTTGGGLKCILNDATSGTGDELMQIGVPADDSKYLLFIPPMPFATGIRVGTLEVGLVVTGCFD